MVARKVSGLNPRFFWTAADGAIRLNYRTLGKARVSNSAQFAGNPGASNSYFSEASSRRSRWGAVRGSPVLSSHGFPGLAPQVGHRTARAAWSFLAFIPDILRCRD